MPFGLGRNILRKEHRWRCLTEDDPHALTIDEQTLIDGLDEEPLKSDLGKACGFCSE